MPYRIDIAIQPAFSHQVRWAYAMQMGLRRHNVAAEIRSHHVGYRKRDAIVTWGVHQQSLFQFRRHTGQEVLVMERGYLGDRRDYTAVGWNGLNGRADFCVNECPADRFEALDIELEDWRSVQRGEYVLVLGQVPGDSSHSHADIDRELQRAVGQLRSWTELPILYRPHPLAASRLAGVQTAGTASLEDHLRGAAFAVTFNSNAGVDAVLAGVPTITCDEGAMAYCVTDHDPSRRPSAHDRDQWVRDLAYCQWSRREIEAGEAWRHAKQRLECRRNAIASVEA